MTALGATVRLLVICSLLWNAEPIADGGLQLVAMAVIGVLCVQLGDAIAANNHHREDS